MQMCFYAMERGYQGTLPDVQCPVSAVHSHIAAHAAVMSSVSALTSVRLKRRLHIVEVIGGGI